MKNKLSESLSLINRMDKHLSVTEAEEIKKSIQKGIGHGKNYQGEPNAEELQRIVDDLYIQAKKKNIKNLNPNYTIFYIALNCLNDTIRFYYDINEPKGIYTKSPIPPEAFFKIENITAEEKDILSTDKNI